MVDNLQKERGSLLIEKSFKNSATGIQDGHGPIQSQLEIKCINAEIDESKEVCIQGGGNMKTVAQNDEFKTKPNILKKPN
jgi:hypothetical protein